MSPAHDFRFTVTADGAPLENSRVYLVRPRSPSPTEMIGFEVSDGDGTVALTLPATERAPVIVSNDSRSAESFPRLMDMPSMIELGPGLTVSGHVVNEAGEPVGAVRLRGLSFIQDGFGLMQRHRGRTGPDGQFVISGFFAGAASLTTEEGDTFFSQTFELEESADLGTLILKASEVAWIRVADSMNGRAVSTARVRAPSGQFAETNEDGLARVLLDYGRGIRVSADGYLFTQFELPQRAGLTAEEPLLVALVPAFTVEGVFVAADGITPAAGGKVTAMGKTGGLGMKDGIASDGSFSLDLPAGAYDLELTAGNTGLLRLEVQGVEGEARNLGIVSAPPAAWAWGSVVSQDDYAPVAGATVSYTRPSIIGPLLASAIGNVSTVTTDAEGYFEMFGLELGTSTVRVQADGFASRKVDIAAPVIQGIDVGVVELSRGRRITVHSDTDEGLVALDWGRTGLPQDRLTAKLVEGRTTFNAVPEEPFGILVYENGDAVCEKYEDDAVGDKSITCNRNAARVTGLVTKGDQPGSGVLLWRRGSERRLPEGFLRYNIGPFARTDDLVSTQTLELKAPLGSDGRYHLPSVLPGEWEVIWAPLSGGTQDVRSVTVPESRDAMLDLHYDGVSIEGMVLDPEGLPTPRANVTVFPSRRTVATDQNGRFQILGLESGTHQLRARLKHLRSALVEAELDGSTDREVVQLLLEGDPPTEELLISITGGSTGFCFVEMDSSPQKIVQIHSGVARIRPDPPLSDNLRVACHTEGRWLLDGWRDLRRALDRGIEFDAYDSNSSMIFVGEPSPVRVQITGPGGWDLGRLRCWFDGASTFSVGERVSNLPVGEYTVRWRNQARTVRTERRRTVEVEVEGP